MSGPLDPLWDPRTGAAGPRDAELEALERALRPLRHDGRPFDVRALPASPPAALRRRVTVRTAAAAAAAAAVVIIAAVAVWALRDLHVGVVVLLPEDLPRSVAAESVPVTVRLGGLASLDLRPGGEVEARSWGKGEVHLRLVRGSLRADVAPAPAVPGRLVVATPYGRVRAGGSRFELTLAADSLQVRVASGGVEVEGARTVVVPAGAATTAEAGRVATPLFDDARDSLHGLVRKFDEATALQLAEQRKELVDRVVTACTAPRDTLVLWHLLGDESESFRELAEVRLLELVGPPPGVELPPSKGIVAPHLDPAVWLAFLRDGAWRAVR